MDSVLDNEDAAGMDGRQTVAQAAAAALVRHGVEVMFSQCLPSALVLACEDAGIRQVAYRTENAGGAMADGYARSSGRIGVVCAQNGPAATLLVPPLSEAMKSSIPVVAFVQEVNRTQSDRNAFQELDHISLFQSSTKWVRRVTEPTRIDDYIDMAFVAAGSGRPGPVVLLLPADLLNEIVVASKIRSVSHSHWPIDRSIPNPREIKDAAALIAKAEHPIIIAGGGTHGSGATDALAALQESASIPVATTIMGKGAVDETHPLTIGLIGNIMGHGSIGQFMRPLIDRSDLFVFVGTRTNQNGTDSWTIPKPGTKAIHIDVDPNEIGRNYEALRLVGDARSTLEALHAALSDQDLSKRTDSRKRIEGEVTAAREKWTSDNCSKKRAETDPIQPKDIMISLDHMITPRTTVVADASYASVWIAAFLTAIRPGQRFIAPRGLAGLGWGLPLAVGSKLATPKNPVVCIVGDGGFGHVWAELETLVREEIALTVVVLNNGILGYQRDAEELRFGRHTKACRFSPVNHATLAKACNCDAFRIRNSSDLTPTLKGALTSTRPTVLDIIVEPNSIPPLSMFD